MEKKERLEKAVTESLQEGEMSSVKPDHLAVERLPSKYEIRQTVELDPIVEETTIIRSMAKEIDDRYDEYMKRSQRGENEEKPLEQKRDQAPKQTPGQ